MEDGIATDPGLKRHRERELAKAVSEEDYMNYKTPLLVAVLGATALVPAVAVAQDAWPTKPVRLVVPYGAGGAADTLARTVADELGRSLGQQFVVENVTGAGGIIALGQLAQAEPDGYTFGINNISTTVIAPFINEAVTYDPIEDFDYVALLGGSPTVWVVNPDSGYTSVDDLAAAAETSDRPLGYGSPGAGTLSHLIALKYWADAGIPMEHFPYQGADLAFLDVVGNHIPFASGTLSTAKGYIDNGQVIPLAISTPERDPAYPDLPTFEELGHGELTSTTWFGLIGPAGIDPAIIEELNAEVNRILELDNVKARLEPDGLTGERLSPEEFRQYQIDQSEIFGPIAQQAITE